MILKRSRPYAAITTEAEAVDALTTLQPGLLIVVSPLEEGDAISLCRRARQQQPKLRILLFLDPQDTGSAVQEIDALVDAVLHPLDIGHEEYPIMKGLMAILRDRRYRSPSLRQPQHGVTGPPPAPEQRSTEPS
ncbi:hypothetical protein [Synechococcus sp. BA-132 BA5]|uniref:hypothetical protein n=1 Tax=Synechococcus sp. BA-132 BA5 TaxID=3110252 RepID=UPI002B20B344|nr:hypothetical protein [Synechococcus sp. BA-132 BA5]MEA5416650.1 hypothetical protein [Synechococcus sp. BA-132 BA5]